MRIIALYIDGDRYVLEDSAALLSRAHQALARWSGTSGGWTRSPARCRRWRSRTCATRPGRHRRSAAAGDGPPDRRRDRRLMVELGTDGRLLALQLDELMAGSSRGALAARCGTTCRRARADGAGRPTTGWPASRWPAGLRRPLRASARTSCWTCRRWPRPSGPAWPTTSTSRSVPAATGCSPGSPGCRSRPSTSIMDHFGGLQKILSASVEDLQETTGSRRGPAPEACARGFPGWPSRAGRQLPLRPA